MRIAVVDRLAEERGRPRPVRVAVRLREASSSVRKLAGAALQAVRIKPEGVPPGRPRGTTVAEGRWGYDGRGHEQPENEHVRQRSRRRHPTADDPVAVARDGSRGPAVKPIEMLIVGHDALPFAADRRVRCASPPRPPVVSKATYSARSANTRGNTCRLPRKRSQIAKKWPAAASVARSLAVEPHEARSKQAHAPDPFFVGEGVEMYPSRTLFEALERPAAHQARQNPCKSQ